MSMSDAMSRRGATARDCITQFNTSSSSNVVAIATGTLLDHVVAIATGTLTVRSRDVSFQNL